MLDQPHPSGQLRPVRLLIRWHREAGALTNQLPALAVWRFASSSASVGIAAIVQCFFSPGSQPRRDRFKRAISRRSVFARRCSRETGHLWELPKDFAEVVSMSSESEHSHSANAAHASAATNRRRLCGSIRRKVARRRSPRWRGSGRSDDDGWPVTYSGARPLALTRATHVVDRTPDRVLG